MNTQKPTTGAFRPQSVQLAPPVPVQVELARIVIDLEQMLDPLPLPEHTDTWALIDTAHKYARKALSLMLQPTVTEGKS